MQIGIAAVSFDLDGAFLFEALDYSKINSGERRVYREPLLNGSVLITDSGFSHGDSNVSISARLDESIIESFWSFFQRTSNIILSSKYGCFSAYFISFNNDFGVATIELYIEESLSNG